MKIETRKNLAGVLLLYLLIVLGVIALNARMSKSPNMSSSITTNANISAN